MSWKKHFTRYNTGDGTDGLAQQKPVDGKAGLKYIQTQQTY